jgi:penicillin-binding protein 2
MHAPARNKEQTGPETPRVFWRVLFLGIFMLVGLSVLAVKLWYEQVERSQKWKDRVRKSSVVSVRIPSVRGEIRDRNGIRLVTNRSSYCIDFDLPAIVKGWREAHPGKEVPTVEYRATIDKMPKDVRVPDIVKILNDWVIPKFVALELEKEDPAVRLDYNAEQLERHFRTNERVPFQYLYNVSFETVAKLAENDFSVPGVEITVRPVREYVYGALAPHILGYVGKPEDINKEADIDAFTYYQPDVVGRASVEAGFDKYLRGEPGRKVLERTPKGRVGEELTEQYVPPRPGAHVYLAIDARIQMIVENALRQAGIGRGAAVVVNPSNGDVLAMASVPSYDPNLFIPSLPIEELKKFDADDTDPLLNRDIVGYVPGSTFKVVTALAGLAAGISPKKMYNCPGGIVYGNRLMKCHIADRGGSHGSLDLSNALKKSCNCYFYLLANDIGENGEKLGLHYIERIGQAMGLGVRSELPLSGEKGGLLPGPRWLTEKGLGRLIESSGNIANTSIGQGMVQASPLQMAMVTATLANGGMSYFPRIVSRVVDSEGNDVRDPDGNFVVPVEPKVRANLRDLGIPSAQIEIVRRGLWRVVNEPGGTGSRAAIKGVEVAGKTGTAQFKREVKTGEFVKDNRVWFMCFAPYNQPKFAICVMVEGAKSGGGVAAPIVQKILKESLALEAGYDPKIAWLDPAMGSFDPIEQITLKEDGSLTKLVAAAFQGTDARPNARPNDEEESAVDNGEAQVERRRVRKDVAAPDVRAAADARGRAAVRAQPAARKPNFWERMFGPRQRSNPPNQRR